TRRSSPRACVNPTTSSPRCSPAARSTCSASRCRPRRPHMPPGNPLENLARAKQLAAEPTSAQEIGRLLKGAEEQLRDGGNASISATSRFTLAYGAAHALAL